MRDDEGEVSWAQEIFGGAELGDPRRTARLVAMGAAAARSPAGQVTQVFTGSAEREGAFRLLESEAVRSSAVSEAVFAATAHACDEETLVYVAVDQTTLTLTDRKKVRDLGRVGPRFPTRGLHVMNALAVDVRGTPIGMLEQCWWARTRRPRSRKIKCYGKAHLQKESRYWLDALKLCDDRLHEQAPQSRGWYQLDRGADAWPVFELAVERNLLITVRSVHDRRLLREDGSRGYLRQTLKKQKILGHYTVEVSARPGRVARTARITLKACPVVLHARVRSGGRRKTFVFNAVLAEEADYRGKDRIRWTLLTTAPIKTFQQVRAVVAGYAMRWLIEELHRAWKRGVCRVEDSQLQSRGAILKWATILAAVAARAIRLAKLIRASPDTPASEEFTEYEIDAAFILLKKKRDRRRAYSLSEMIDLVADIGGFANKYSRLHPLPGATIIARGLERVRILAIGLENMADLR